jgi:hypothetical protein
LVRGDRIYRGIEGGSAEAVYDLYSFFLNAYHFRDWLIGADGLEDEKIKQAMRRSKALSVCRDFAMGVKHFKLDRPAWVDPQTGTTRQDVTVFPRASR